MHDGSIAEELVEQAVAQAKQGGIGRITRVWVSLGEDSHITGEALISWFDVVKTGTIAEQAVLEIARAEGDDIMMLSLQGEERDGL
ncbi:MAG: hydrogenase maturation nickel metallochaperone HypA [Chloroflexota bacterium]|nr:hydrogenase maturation nickel metallochaperone HypA [Chloroflexota bacterium]